MPKIEVDEEKLYQYIGKRYSHQALEELFPAAKAELDGVDEDEGVLKVELNDTNRPDLWSTAGLARQLRVYEGGPAPTYSFFSRKGNRQDCGDRLVEVDSALQDIRPYIAAFAVSGKPLDEAALKDIIQTQEKLCWNYGRKRKSIAMGVYRSDLFRYPVKYVAADPETTRFVPLQLEEELNLKEICREHPKGREFGPIVENFDKYPFITDADNKVLSFPPVINSAEIGAVQEGDANLFIELTGTDMASLQLAANIVACDLADLGYEILPVKVVYPYDTPLGREVVSPCFFQEPLTLEAAYANKLLGEDLSAAEMIEALGRMGIAAEARQNTLQVAVPEYRNDFLHPIDIVEDIMIGRGMDSFEPVMPSESTIGRLSREEEFARQVKNIMIGMGFQEMIYNYLGSRRDFIDRMNLTGESFIRIANPMTENYEYVRASILPCLLQSESVSANAVYPHNIFEIGKIAHLELDDNSGTITKNSLGFLSGDKDSGYNTVNSHISAIFYYLNREYSLQELNDPRFIKGRSATLLCQGLQVGLFGEIHPAVLENWGITMPVTACEIDLDALLRA